MKELSRQNKAYWDGKDWASYALMFGLILALLLVFLHSYRRVPWLLAGALIGYSFGFMRGSAVTAQFIESEPKNQT